MEAGKWVGLRSSSTHADAEPNGPRSEAGLFLPQLSSFDLCDHDACHNEANKLLETVDETVYELLVNPFLVLGIPPS